MPYTQVYKARYLDGSVGFLTEKANVLVPGFSNVLMNSPGYIGGIDNLNIPTTNLNFLNMRFIAPSVIRGSNLLLTSNITGSNLFAFTNSIAAANINFINYIGTLQPYANTMTTGNLIVGGTIIANGLRGSTLFANNAQTQSNAFSDILVGAVNTYANNILTVNVSTGTYITSGITGSNIISGNVVATTLTFGPLVGSNSVITSTQISCNVLFANATSNMITSLTPGFDVGLFVGNFTPFTNAIAGNVITAINIVGGPLVSYTNSITSTTITGGNVIGIVNTFTNTITSTSTLTAATFLGGFTTSNTILTTGTVTGSTSLRGAVLGANTLSTVSTLTGTTLFGAIRAFANNVSVGTTTTAREFNGALTTFINNISVTNVWASSLTALQLVGDRSFSANLITSNIIGPIVAYANTVQTGTKAIAQNFVGDINLGSGPLVTQSTCIASNLIGGVTAFANNITIDQTLYAGTLIGNVIGSNNMETLGLFQSSGFYGGITSTGYVRTDADMTGAQLIGSIAGSNTITVVGNVSTFSANFIGAVFTTNVFTQTLIVGSLSGNIKTFQNSITTTSFIVASNVVGQILSYANTISTQTNVSYGTDLSRSGVFLRPDTSNSVFINQSITQNFANAYSQQMWWSTPTTTSPVSYYSTNGQTGWYGSVLLPDGRVCFVPDTARSIGFLNIQTNTFSNIVPGGDGISSLGGGWRGGILMPDSNVVFLPYSNAFLCMYDPTTNILRKRQSPLPGRFLGGCLLPNGNVLCVPNQLGSILHELNPYADVGVEQKFIGVGSGSFNGCVLNPDSTVLLIPDEDIFAFIYKYDQNAFNSLQSIQGLATGPNFFRGGVYLPTGRIFVIPNASNYSYYIRGTTPTEGPTIAGSSFGCFAGNGKVVMSTNGASVTVFDIYSEQSYSVACNTGYIAPVATPCGRVVFSPQTATGGVMVMNLHAQTPPCVALSPYFNKL
jgi:hypothetical protein